MRKKESCTSKTKNNNTQKRTDSEVYYIGIDPSTTSLGVCVINKDGEIEYVTHSKRLGKLKDWETKNNHAIDLFKEVLDEYTPSHVFMEHAVFSSHSSTSVLYELCGVLKYVYFNHPEFNKIRSFYTIMPRVWQHKLISTVKPTKEDTLVEMERYFDIDFKSDDESDAAGIALFCYKYHTERGFKESLTKTKDKKTKKMKSLENVVIKLSY